MSYLFNPLTVAKDKKLDFNRSYNYWCNMLRLRIINLFVWEGLQIPQEDLEYYLLQEGFSGIIKSGELIATKGSLTGVTDYPDKFVTYVYSTPTKLGVRTIGKDVVICKSNSGMVSMIPFIQRYAYFLSHADLTLQSLMINFRATDLIASPNSKVSDSVQEYYTAMINGSIVSVVDDEGLETPLESKGLRSITQNKLTSGMIKDVYDVTRNILRDFYADVGVKVATEKKEREIVSEVEANDNMLLFNVSDMLSCRQQACDDIKKIFGYDVKVKLNPHIEALMEGDKNVQD